MSPLELQSGHHTPKELTPFSTWLLTRLTIIVAAAMSLTPFAIGYVFP